MSRGAVAADDLKSKDTKFQQARDYLELKELNGADAELWESVYLKEALTGQSGVSLQSEFLRSPEEMEHYRENKSAAIMDVINHDLDNLVESSHISDAFKAKLLLGLQKESLECNDQASFEAFMSRCHDLNVIISYLQMPTYEIEMGELSSEVKAQVEAQVAPMIEQFKEAVGKLNLTQQVSSQLDEGNTLSDVKKMFNQDFAKTMNTFYRAQSFVELALLDQTLGESEEEQLVKDEIASKKSDLESLNMNDLDEMDDEAVFNEFRVHKDFLLGGTKAEEGGPPRETLMVLKKKASRAKGVINLDRQDSRTLPVTFQKTSEASDTRYDKKLKFKQAPFLQLEINPGEISDLESAQTQMDRWLTLKSDALEELKAFIGVKQEEIAMDLGEGLDAIKENITVQKLTLTEALPEDFQVDKETLDAMDEEGQTRMKTLAILDDIEVQIKSYDALPDGVQLLKECVAPAAQNERFERLMESVDRRSFDSLEEKEAAQLEKATAQLRANDFLKDAIYGKIPKTRAFLDAAEAEILTDEMISAFPKEFKNEMNSASFNYELFSADERMTVSLAVANSDAFAELRDDLKISTAFYYAKMGDDGNPLNYEAFQAWVASKNIALDDVFKCFPDDILMQKYQQKAAFEGLTSPEEFKVEMDKASFDYELFSPQEQQTVSFVVANSEAFAELSEDLKISTAFFYAKMGDDGNPLNSKAFQAWAASKNIALDDVVTRFSSDPLMENYQNKVAFESLKSENEVFSQLETVFKTKKSALSLATDIFNKLGDGSLTMPMCQQLSEIPGFAVFAQIAALLDNQGNLEAFQEFQKSEEIGRAKNKLLKEKVGEEAISSVAKSLVALATSDFWK